MTRPRPGCGEKTKAIRFCRPCNTEYRRLLKVSKKMEWTLDKLGGAFWVWDKMGNVLGMGGGRFIALKDAYATDLALQTIAEARAEAAAGARGNL